MLKPLTKGITMGEYFQSFDPSTLAREFMSHLKALEPLETLSVGKSLSLAKERFRLPVFRHIAQHWYNEHPLKISFIAIEHAESFEICRLPDALNPDAFYSVYEFLAESEKPKVFSDARLLAVTNAARLFVQSTWSMVKNYCVGMPEEMRRENIIPYAYFQRKLGAVAAFRKAENGSTEAMKEAIAIAVERGILRKLEKSEVYLRYQRNADCYEYLLPVRPLPRL